MHHFLRFFSRFALAPAPPQGSRQHDENELQKCHENDDFYYFFGSARLCFGSISQNGFREARREALGPSRATLGTLKPLSFSPRGAPGRGHGFFLTPGPPPGAIWSAPGAHLGPSWRPRAPRKPPGVHFRGPRGRFSTFRGSIYQPCGAAKSRAKTKQQAIQEGKTTSTAKQQLAPGSWSERLLGFSSEVFAFSSAEVFGFTSAEVLALSSADAFGFSSAGVLGFSEV